MRDENLRPAVNRHPVRGSRTLCRLLCLFFFSFSVISNAQVSTGYTFANLTAPAHVALAGGTTLSSGLAIDDAVYTNVPIGFTFNFNGTDYTTVGVSTNGFIWFGSTNPAANDYGPVSSATAMAGVASCFGGNLAAKAAAATIKYTTTGTCPNRVFMVEWSNMKVVTKTSRIDLQITLTEGTNNVELHPFDASYLVSDTYNAQVGLRGASSADFNNRSIPCSGAGNWAASTAGGSNAAFCTINGALACAFTSIYPGAPGGSAASVARYRFTNLSSVSAITWNGSVDADWFNAANWTPAIVPTIYRNVSVPASLAVYPILSGSSNAFCRSLTLAAGSSLSAAAGYSGTLSISGSLTNDGTIINNGNNYMTLTGTTGTALGGLGDFTAADLFLSGACATYTMSNAIVMRKLNIGVSASLSMNTYNLTVLSALAQTGTINQSSGILQVEDPACTLTNATFNENTGTTYFAIGTSTGAANQIVPSITYYNLKVNTNNGFTASIGNGGTVTCNNLTINNPGASGGIASVVNAVSVNANFDLAPAGNTPTVNLSNNVTVAGIMTLYKGVITTGGNKVIISNSAAGAVVQGGSNVDYTLSYINGNLRRMILSGAVANYDFPMGDATTPRYIMMMDNALSGGGFTYIDAVFLPLTNHSDAAMIATEPSEPGVAYDHICTEGVWYLDPDNQPAAGTYDIKAYTSNFSGLSDDQFAVLKRISASVTGADWDNGGASATRPASMQPGRTLASGYALRFGLSSFSQFGIATHPLIVLPIELLSFTGRKAGKENVLEWLTASEHNNDYFSLERSADALDFYEIVKVDGAGNSSLLISYARNDETPLAGISYYRLKQTDFDGRSAYSNVIALDRSAANFELLNVYGTPGQIEITISCSGGCAVLFELYNAEGRLLLSSPGHVAGEGSRWRIPVDGLSKGIYLLKAVNGDTVITKKIIL